jgi:hypothetical protein
LVHDEDPEAAGRDLGGKAIERTATGQYL